MKILAVASDGGHWVELCRIMRPMEKIFSIHYVGTHINQSSEINGNRFYRINDFSRTDWYKFILVLFQAIQILLRTKSDVVITTGAAPGLIMVFVGWLFRKKTIWIDSLANVEHLSLSGRIASLFVSRVYTQWEGLQNGKKIVFAGNIIGSPKRNTI